ncbi:MAG TPA: pseudouridine synthase [Verrucomicrobiae bacterium]|jgi:23S rRNA pseudouridine2605 synthase|nr:pseudouridine synthase [Verrucomicrobiae bacterium]
MRISRALALAGIDSRRKCELHVTNGAVKVNGEVVFDLGRQVDPEKDSISFRGKRLTFGGHIYYVMNKPVGYMTTASDPHAPKTVYDLLPRTLVKSSRQTGTRTRVFPVGRLDKDSMGLLLFTNDGELANKLIHPRYHVSKWYEVRVHRAFERSDIPKMVGGLRLEDGWARVERVHPVSPRIIHVSLAEGKKREVRRIFEKLEYKVLRLVRFAFGPLTLGSLPLGKGRFLNKNEIRALKQAVAGTEDTEENEDGS